MSYNNLTLSSSPLHDNAYVWLLMMGDSYLPGVFASVYSVLRTNPNADLVIMVTDDVSDKARSVLLTMATHLFYIPYIQHATSPLKTKKQNAIYGSWISKSFTKWNMLALPYNKALFLDADTIITTNLDHLFKLKTPAAPFNNPFTRPLGYISNKLPNKVYANHKAIINPKIVKNMLKKNGMVGTANSMLLSPNIDDYKLYNSMLREYKIYGLANNCYAGHDEQSIAEFYSILKKVNWVNIHQRYNYIGWKDGFLTKDDIPAVVHYFSQNKPWNMAWNEYEDVIDWYKVMSEAIKYAQLQPKLFKINKLDLQLAERKHNNYVKKFTTNKNIKSLLDIHNYNIVSNEIVL